jgi:hypothetical protein
MKTVVKDEKGHKKTLSKLVALLGALVAGNLDALFLLPFELATAFDLHDRGMYVEVMQGR